MIIICFYLIGTKKLWQRHCCLECDFSNEEFWQMIFDDGDTYE
jgi:hypothetical protein